MDHQPFRLARPMSRQLALSLCTLLRQPAARLDASHADAVATLAMSEHVDHATVLAAVTLKLEAGTVQRPRRDRSGGRHRHDGTGPAGGPPMADNEPAAPAEMDTAPALPVRAARPLIRGLQRFPPSMRTGTVAAEGLSVRALAAGLPVAEMTSTEVAQLWGVAAQLSEWADVEAVCAAFPLAAALPLQSAQEFTEVLAAVVTCTQHSGNNSSSTPVKGHREALLWDVIGERVAWGRCAEALEAAAAAPREKQAFTLPLRVSNAVMLAASAATTTSLTAAAPDFPFSEAQWLSLVTPQGPSSLSGLSLHGWYHRLAALEQPAVPSFVRSSCRAAMVADLWRVHTDRGDAEATLLFRGLGLPALSWQERWLQCSSSSGVAGGDGIAAASRSYHSDMLQRFVPLRLPNQSNSGTNNSGNREAALASLAPDALANLLLGFSFHVPGAAASEVEDASAALLLGRLVAAVQLAAADLRRALPKLRDPPHRCDDLVRAWPVMETVSLLVALEQLFYMGGGSGGGSPTAFASGSARAAERQGQREQLLAAVTSTALLSEEVLRSHGGARAVATLLLQAPRTTAELGLTAVCVDLVSRHALDGFTHAQLSGLLLLGATNGGGGGGGPAGPVTLPAEVAAAVAAALAVVSDRREAP